MVKATINPKKPTLTSIITIIIVVLIGILGGSLTTNIVRDSNGDFGITIEAPALELAEGQAPAIIENEDGTTEAVEVPTVEIVDNGKQIEQEDAQGAWHDTTTPQAYRDSVYGQCLNNAYGAQCFSLASDFWSNYAGRALSSCGTGAAKGTTNCWEYNAGDEFVMIWDASQIQTGDWVVFSGGQYGHIGMAMGDHNNGYVTLLGQNQGGPKCPLGGAAANIINKSTKDFIGAFRPKSYIKVEPTPEIPISGCLLWHVQRGDTMGKIMMDCEGTIHYGEIMNEYAKTWYSLIVKPGQSVYEGWTTGSHYGLYAGDDIEHRTQ